MDHNRKRWQCPRKSSSVKATTCLSLSKRYCSISWGIQHGGHCHDDHCFECPAIKCHPGGATVSKQNQENDWWSGNQKTAKYFVFDFDEKVTKCSEWFCPRTCSSFVVGGGGLQVTLQLSHCFCVCRKIVFDLLLYYPMNFYEGVCIRTWQMYIYWYLEW